MADKIRYADYGFAGLFDTDKVDEPILDQLYQFDNALVTVVNEIETLANALSADSPTLTSDVALSTTRSRRSGSSSPSGNISSPEQGGNRWH